MLPTFLVLGVARTGTTWLHSILSKHPEIFVPEVKEPCFLNERILREPWENYPALFRSANGQKRIRGDMSVNYTILLPPIVERIKQLMPDLRLVMTLRHPVERMWSQLKYDRMLWGYKPYKRTPLLSFFRECESPRLIRRNDYQMLIETWENAFGIGALHVDLYDRLASDPYGYVRDVLWHLGADSSWQPPEKLMAERVNASNALDIPPVLRWYLSRQWLEPTRRLNDKLDGRLSKWVAQMEEVASDATLSRRMLKHLNRAILSLPTRLAYGVYDARRQAALAREYDRIMPSAAPVEERLPAKSPAPETQG